MCGQARMFDPIVGFAKRVDRSTQDYLPFLGTTLECLLTNLSREIYGRDTRFGRESRRVYHARMVVDQLLGVIPTEVVSWSLVLHRNRRPLYPLGAPL
jgi:hypothetical protein